MTKEEYQKGLGDNLRRVRLEKNWTIERVALESGLAYSQLGRIELGRRNPTAYTLFIIAKTLKVKTSDLIDVIE